MANKEQTNAYFELFGTTETVSEDDIKAIATIESLESADVVEITEQLKERFGENYRGIRGKRTFKVTPHINSAPVREWIDNVAWGYVHCDKDAVLPSNRTIEDEVKFLETLQSINYYSGYGIQELYGTIVFKDNSWLERGEYDGSEWWQRCQTPKEPDWSQIGSNEL